MKRTLLFSIGIAVSAISYAQEANPLHQGRVQLGLGLSGNMQTSKFAGSSTNVDNRSLYISPQVSYFCKNNNSVGLALNYRKEEYPNGSGENSTNESIGGAIRKSRYWPLGAGFSLAGHLDLSYAHSTSKNWNGSTLQKATGDYVGLYLAPGVTYVARNRFLLELGLNSLAGFNYARGRSKDLTGFERISNSYSFYSSLGQQNPLFFSLNVLLGK